MYSGTLEFDVCNNNYNYNNLIETEKCYIIIYYYFILLFKGLFLFGSDFFFFFVFQNTLIPLDLSRDKTK